MIIIYNSISLFHQNNFIRHIGNHNVVVYYIFVQKYSIHEDYKCIYNVIFMLADFIIQVLDKFDKFIDDDDDTSRYLYRARIVRIAMNLVVFRPLSLQKS